MPSKLECLALLFCLLALSTRMVSADCIGSSPDNLVDSRDWFCIDDHWTYRGTIFLMDSGTRQVINGTYYYPYRLTITGPTRITGNLFINETEGITFRPPIRNPAWNTTRPALLVVDGCLQNRNFTYLNPPRISFHTYDIDYLDVLKSLPSRWSFTAIRTLCNIEALTDAWNYLDFQVYFNTDKACLNISNSYSMTSSIIDNTTRARSYELSANIRQIPYYGNCGKNAPSLLPKSSPMSPGLIVVFVIAGSLFTFGVFGGLCAAYSKKIKHWFNSLDCSCCCAPRKVKSLGSKPASAADAIADDAPEETSSLLPRFLRDQKLKNTPVFVASFGASNPFSEDGDDLSLKAKKKDKKKKKKANLATSSADPTAIDSVDEVVFSDAELGVDTIQLQEWNSEPNEGTAAAFVSHEAHRY